MDPEPKILF